MQNLDSLIECPLALKEDSCTARLNSFPLFITCTAASVATGAIASDLNDLLTEYQTVDESSCDLVLASQTLQM